MIEEPAIYHKDNQVRIVYHSLGKHGVKFTVLWGTVIFLFFGFAFKLFFLFPIYCFVFYVFSLLVVFYDFKKRDYDILTLGFSKESVHISSYVTNPYLRYHVDFELDTLEEIQWIESDWCIVFRTNKPRRFSLSRDIPLDLITEALRIIETGTNVPLEVRSISSGSV